MERIIRILEKLVGSFRQSFSFLCENCADNVMSRVKESIDCGLPSCV